MKEYWFSKTIYRQIILALGAFQLLGFFLIPYGYRYRALNDMAKMISRYGTTYFPKHLTGFSMLRVMFSYDEGGVWVIWFFLVLILAVLGVHVAWKGVGGYITSLCVEVVILPFHGLLTMLADDVYGYSSSGAVFLLFLIALAIIVVSIVGIVLEHKAQAALDLAGGAPYAAYRFECKVAEVAGKCGIQFKKGPEPVSPYGTQGTPPARRSGTGVQQVNRRPAPPSTPRAIPLSGQMTGVRGPFAGTQIPVKSGESMTLGRSREFCNVIVEGGMVSRRHCVVTYDGRTGNYVVTDYSENGTFISTGARLPARQRVSIAPGTVIWIGSKDISFQLG